MITILEFTECKNVPDISYINTILMYLFQDIKSYNLLHKSMFPYTNYAGI